MNENGLEVSGIHKRFAAVRVLNGVDLACPAGMVTGLLGRNGSGKSTLLNCIAGRLREERGQIRFQGHSLPQEAAWRRAQRGIASTFQDVARPITLTVTELARLAAPAAPAGVAYSGVGLTALREAVAPFADRQWKSLSFGQRKLAGLSIAVAQRPAVMLLDEPAAGLSMTALELLIASLDDLKSAGVAVLVIDHNRAVLEKTAARLAVLAAGKILIEGAPATVFAAPETLEALI